MASGGDGLASGGLGAAAVGRPRRSLWTAAAAFVWAVVFAVAHGAWALGDCTGLPAADCEAGLAGWFFAYNLIAGALCAVGAAVALALLRPRGRLAPRSRLLARIGGWVLVVRGGVGLVQDALVLGGAVGSGGWEPTMAYDPWFLLGGVLFLLAARSAQAAGVERGRVQSHPSTGSSGATRSGQPRPHRGPS